MRVFQRPRDDKSYPGGNSSDTGGKQVVFQQTAKPSLATPPNCPTDGDQLSLPTSRLIRHNGTMSQRSVEITPDLMLRAYQHGLFPMADSRDNKSLVWLDPENRGILPLDRFHVSRRLLRTVLARTFDISVDRDFRATIASCAAPAPGREDTWINPQIERLFGELYRMGYAHSVECRQSGILVGGLYGVALGGAFFGESMFSFVTDASKAALVHLVARLRLGGFQLLDTQFVTAHLVQFGAEEIPRDTYKLLLEVAVDTPATWLPSPDPATLVEEIRALRQP